MTQALKPVEQQTLVWGVRFDGHAGKGYLVSLIRLDGSRVAEDEATKTTASSALAWLIRCGMPEDAAADLVARARMCDPAYMLTFASSQYDEWKESRRFRPVEADG
jgi:hypothetical protein